MDRVQWRLVQMRTAGEMRLGERKRWLVANGGGAVFVPYYVGADRALGC
jgi:hypothetical protein